VSADLLIELVQKSRRALRARATCALVTDKLASAGLAYEGAGV
jgi:hypothetical protein